MQPPGNQPFARPGRHKLGQRGHGKGHKRHANGIGDRVARIARVEVVREEGRQPLRHLQRHQQRQCQCLRRTAAPAPPRAVGGKRALLRRTGGCHAQLQRLGDGADAAVLVDVTHRRQRKTRVGAQCGRQARRQQRMAAQVVEKIHVAPHRLAGEELDDSGKQGLFGWGFWRVAALCRCGSGQWLGLEGFAVDLARRQARHGRKWLKTRGHHVGRQFFGQPVAQGRWGGRLARRHIESDQLVQAIVLAQQHRRGAHAGLLCQHGFDFAQLHAKAANLHLVVCAAQALHLAVLHARQVARAVQALVVLARGPGVGQKLFGRQIGAPQVACGHTGAGNAQFPRFTKRQDFERRQLAVHHAVRVDHLDNHQPVVGQRLADGYGLAALQ